MSGIETSNAYFELAARYVSYTDKHVFLTGKAGTGKTTFLKYIRESCAKKMAVVAPTGVAAVNAAGVTIHSFFQLPFGSFVPQMHQIWGGGSIELNNPTTLLKGLKLAQPKRQLIREIELLVIDEVSMLRADMLDAIDTVLRHVRQQPDTPFGGVQMLFIGDLFQLPPVVKREEWQLLGTYYSSPFFFDAQVLKQSSLLTIELSKVYRQQDDHFIEILNRIRNNEADARVLESLMPYYRPAYRPDHEEGLILLTTHNAKADTINEDALASIDTPSYNFQADIKGDFPDKVSPVARNLQLKIGAQVMFVKNDKGENRRYYNGKIAVVSDIREGKIFVRLHPGDHTEMELEKEVWKNINFKYNRNTDEVEEEELGSFAQFPVRLAWAITIHKSQGLTFDRAVVDAGDAFAAGQVYVALSRLRSLDGLILLTPIHTAQIFTDPRVVAYAGSVNDTSVLEQEINYAERNYASRKLLDFFDFDKLFAAYNDHYLSLSASGIPDKMQAIELAFAWQNTCEKLLQTAQKFRKQLSMILNGETQVDYVFLKERTFAAATYFLELLQPMRAALQIHIQEFEIKPRTKKYVGQLRFVLQSLVRKILQLEQSKTIADGLLKETDFGKLFELIAEDRKQQEEATALQTREQEESPKKEAVPSKHISMQLYKEGKTIEEIAIRRSMARSTIEGHITAFISTGEVGVEAFVSTNELSLILSEIQQADTVSATQLKARLGDRYSYAQIRAVMAYRQYLREHG